MSAHIFTERAKPREYCVSAEGTTIMRFDSRPEACRYAHFVRGFLNNVTVVPR